MRINPRTGRPYNADMSPLKLDWTIEFYDQNDQLLSGYTKEKKQLEKNDALGICYYALLEMPEAKYGKCTYYSQGTPFDYIVNKTRK